jgi:hypothetical protein
MLLSAACTGSLPSVGPARRPFRETRRHRPWFGGGVITTCPRCFSADDVTYERLPDQLVEFACSRNHDGDGPYRWIAALDDLDLHEEADAGITDELLDPLSDCVVAGEPWVEYGIVEYRFRLRHPDLFAAHVRERGHRMLGPHKVTASGVRFAMALGRLSERGELVRIYGPATGAWAPQDITYWARPPGPPTTSRVTWATWCADHGRSPDWTDDDRAGF